MKTFTAPHKTDFSRTIFPRRLVPAALLPALALLAGCSSLPSTSSFLSRSEFSSANTIPVTRDTTPIGVTPVERPQNSAALEAQRLAVMTLPASAGTILKVREKHHANGSRQEIILDSGKGVYGENVIDVSIRTAEASPRHTDPLRIGPPSQSGIRNEILSRFPDMQMNIVTRPMRNSFGAFGLAIGRHAAGYRCVFAWQWFDELREGTPGASNFTKLGAYLSNKSLATSVRIRLCRNDFTVDQMAGFIESLQSGSLAAVERIAKMDRRQIDSDGGEEIVSANGVRRTPLLRPVTASLEAALPGSSRSAKPGIRTASRPAPRRQAQANPAPRRRTARPAPQQRLITPAQAPAVAPPPAYNYGGGRYLAPVNAPVNATVPSYPRATPVPAAGTYRPAGNGAGLPPEAYRGPGQS